MRCVHGLFKLKLSNLTFLSLDAHEDERKAATSVSLFALFPLASALENLCMCLCAPAHARWAAAHTQSGRWEQSVGGREMGQNWCIRGLSPCDDQIHCNSPENYPIPVHRIS